MYTDKLYKLIIYKMTRYGYVFKHYVFNIKVME